MEKARKFPTKSREYRNLVAEANSHFTQAIRVTPDVMAITLEALRANNFDFIIAPEHACIPFEVYVEQHHHVGGIEIPQHIGTNQTRNGQPSCREPEHWQQNQPLVGRGT